MANWDTAYVNDLPDSAFLHVAPGGSKDKDGKTVPRSLRHFPVRDAEGKVDMSHLRNALSRIPQAELPEDVKAKCEAEARKMMGGERSQMSDATTIQITVGGDVAGAVKELRNALDASLNAIGNSASDLEASDDAAPVEAFTDDAGRVFLLHSLDVEPGKEPPTRVRLLKRGANPTTKGTVVFNDDSAKSVGALLADHGREQLPFDYGHGMLAESPSPDGGRAAAWFRPSIEPDGLYADRIEWTPFADNAIRNREYRFFSPAVVRDPKTGVVSRLINVALTNLPATKGQRPLVASDDSQPVGAEPKEQPMSDLLKALGAETEEAALTVLSEREAAHTALVAERDTLTTKLADTEARAAGLAEQVAALTAEKAKAQHEALIAELSEAGKLPPCLHDWARGLSFEALSEFGSKAPSAKPEPKQPEHSVVALTDEDRAVMKAHRLTEDQFVAARKAELSTR